MKKTILAVLLCLSLLAGCSGAPAPLPEAEQPLSLIHIFLRTVRPGSCVFRIP